MLAWRSDAGCSGFIEPEQMISICELICFEGCFSSKVVAVDGLFSDVTAAFISLLFINLCPVSIVRYGWAC